jgi:hypothetical protein
MCVTWRSQVWLPICLMPMSCPVFTSWLLSVSCLGHISLHQAPRCSHLRTAAGGISFSLGATLRMTAKQCYYTTRQRKPWCNVTSYFSKPWKYCGKRRTTWCWPSAGLLVTSSASRLRASPHHRRHPHPHAGTRRRISATLVIIFSLYRRSRRRAPVG